MNTKYLLNVRYILKPEKAEDFVRLLNEIGMEEKSGREAGCLLYKYENMIESNGKCILKLREIWESRQAQAEHLKSEHMDKLNQIKNEYVISTEAEEHDVYIPVSEYVNEYDNIGDEAGGVKAVSGRVMVPGSKSMTNRALLLAALSSEESELNGVLFSDDSRHFLACLEDLGFELDIKEDEKVVQIKGMGGTIPRKSGSIDVGSAGTAARFLTAMLGLSDGEYIIKCSKQMEKRPMRPLFEALTEMGAEFEYLKNEGFLPVKVKGNGGVCKDVSMDISKSTQFLSALLMVTPVMKNGLTIHITSEKKTGSYINITMEMLKGFGVNVEYDGEAYRIKGNQRIKVGNYTIEPDVSAACYFYAAAALTGGSIIVNHVYKDSLQGDMKFLNALKMLGCHVTDTDLGIQVDGPLNGKYDGIDIDMNDFSDQALTLAALAAFAKTPTKIRNIGHIRGQECNRIQAIVNELGKCGLNVVEDGDNIIIHPGKVKGTLIETYDDHRVAMAFTLLSLRTQGIIIDNPMCCRKTFENYYEVFEKLLAENQ